MPKTIKYTGSQRRWPELAATGRQSVWFPGQTEQRSDVEASQLLATGLFADIDATQLGEEKMVSLSSLVSRAGILGAQRGYFSMPLPPADSTGGVAKTYDVQFAAKRSFKGVRFLYINLNTVPANYSFIRCAAAPKHLVSTGAELAWSPYLTAGWAAPLAVVFDAALTAATSGNLLANWTGATGLYNIVFSDGSVRTALLTFGTKPVSWTTAVTATASATGYPMITVPAAVAGGKNNYFTPGALLTDNYPLQPVARTDTPTGKYLVRVRSRCLAETQKVYSVGSTFPPAWNAYVGANGPVIGSYQATADQVTLTPSDSTSVLESGGYIQPLVALFAYDNPAPQVWAFGDSLFEGNGSSVGPTAATGILGWPTLIQLQQANLDALNFAVTGQTTADSMAMLYATIKVLDDYPAFVALKVYTPNDGTPTQASVDVSWGHILAACSWLRTRGITPVLFTSPPVNSWNSTQHTLNEAQNARAAALVAACPWVRLVDMWAAVRDPSNTRQLLPAYNYGDGTHLLNAGHQAVAAAAVRVIGG